MPLATALGGLFAGLLGKRGGLPLTDLKLDPPPPPQPQFDARALYETLLGLGAPVESTPFQLYSTRPATAEDTRAMFAPAKPLPGVVPEGFAFDSINNPMDYSGYAGLTEGMRWLGFPYLSELAQRTEYRRISETIAKDMTRRWFRLQATGDDDKTDKIKALEECIKFHKLQEKFTLLALLDGFFGRAHLYIDTGSTDDRDMLKLPLPVDPRTIIPGGLKGLRVVEPMWTYPNALNATDPLRENFYLPQTWWVMGKEIHRTRILPFVGREMPDMMKPAYSYAGLALSQMAKPYVDNWLRTRQSVSDLVHSFSTPVLMTNMGGVLNAGASAQLKMRAALFNYLRDNNNMMILDKNTEDFKNVSVPIGALDHLQAQSQEHMASAVGIPLVVLLGISPSGLNATSEGELQVWAQFIRAAQGSFFDANLVTILNIMQLDLFGVIDPAITHAWEPLRELSEEEVSAAEKTQADVDTAYINAGVLSPDEIRQRLSGEADSPYQGLDLDTPAPPPPMQEMDPLNSMGDPMKAAANDPGTPGAVGGAPAGGHAGPGHMGAAGGSAAPLSPNKGARDDEEIKPGMPNTGHTMIRTQDPNAHIHVHMGPNDRARVKLGADGAFHIATDAEPWDPSKHPRGQPENAGEFGPGGGGGKQPEPEAAPAAAKPAAQLTAPLSEAPPAAAAQPKPEASPAANTARPNAASAGRNAPPHGVEFYSPSVDEHLTLAQASAGLHSERQHLLNTASGEIDQKLGLTATNHDAIGAWSDGAENSVMTEMDGGSWEQLKASVAMKASLANQKDALVFQEQEDGKEHLFSFQATGSVEKIHQDLLDDGVAFHTIVPTQGGATVYAVDMGYDGDATSQAVLKAAQRYGTTPTDQPGRAEFLVPDNKGTTAGEQRHIAQLAYGKLIDKSGVPEVAGVWKGIRPTYGQEFGVTEYPATETTTALEGTAEGSHPATISSRRPSAVDSVEGDKYRRADLDGMKEDPKVFKKNMELLRNARAYPQLRPEETKGKKPGEIADAAIAMAKSNLRFLYDNAPAAVREQGPQWYEGAHAFAAAKAKQYDIPIASAAGVYAALSPQKLWQQNVKQGDAVLDTYFNHRDTPWSPEMDATAARIWKPKDDRILDRIKGKTLGELALPAEKAMWIRTYDEAHDPEQGFNRLSPDGTVLGRYYNLDGKPAKNAWQNTGAISNAIIALESGGNRERISLAMGVRHKVRSFYNNILDPKSANDDVTMDTHAVGAALLAPSTANSTAVGQSLNTSPPPDKQEPGFEGASKSSVTGSTGTYGLWGDAYRQLAHELGIQPRVLQSVTWEAKRKLFDDRMTDETVKGVNAAWDAYHDGKRTLEQTQNDVLRIAGGMDKPEAGLPDPERAKPKTPRAKRAKSVKP